MKRFTFSLFLALLISSFSGYAQTKHFKISVSGGYEFFPKEQHSGKKNGYSVGVEFNYYPIKQLYLVGSLHAGINPGKSGRYTRSGDELITPTYEYIGTLGIGYDIISTTHHIVYMQAGIGAGYINEKWLMLTIENNEQHATSYDAWSTKPAGLCSIGYDYRINGRFSIGANYSAWLIPSHTRSNANIKLSMWF